ncbi:MAG TPA: hypothetical protein VGO40_11445 [Longimicrobium sp.]|jgi:hypothetical protein|nr:hypothetical protein [Longimicrobium sp.]
MSGFTVWLTKDGLRRERDGEPETSVPADVFELLGVWHSNLAEIDPDYTLGDLFSLLRAVQGIEGLSAMLSCDVAAFLAEAEAPPAREDDDGVRFVEVYNTAELTEYVEDPENPDEPLRFVDEDEAVEHDSVADALHDLIGEKKPFRIVDATGDDPITGKPRRQRMIPGTQNGTWVGPYRLDRGFHGWGRWDEPYPGFFAANPEIDPETYDGGFALDFSPVNELTHLPLRYNPAITFRAGRREENVVLEDRITITFGELVHAVFWELGFMGSPEARDANRAELDERLGDLKEMLGGDEDGEETWR